MLKIIIVVAGVAISVVIALVVGAIRWKSATKEIHAKLEESRAVIDSKRYSLSELSGLPVPVQTYFRTVLQEGQPMIRSVRMAHAGMFNMSEEGETWKPFISTQRVITKSVGFDWEGRISFIPGISIRVHDAYIAGEGILYASIGGVISLVNLRGTQEVAEGELMRFFAEAAWYPTALLPSQDVIWEPVDDTSAKATLKDGNIRVTMLFRFDSNHLIESVRAEARGRTVAGSIIPTPWEGRWTTYELHHGIRIPTEGEVSWILPKGPKPYWRGRITKIIYEFAQ